MRLPFNRKVLLASAIGVAAGNVSAGGFEKSILWDAEYAGLAGAGVSSVDNSSAIFFNPAGLAFATENDIAIHASPTITKASGPATGIEGEFIEGEDNFNPVGGFTGLYKFSEKLTMGYGIYAAGGAAGGYDDVTVGDSGRIIPGMPYEPMTGDYSTDIKILGFRVLHTRTFVKLI